MAHESERFDLVVLGSGPAGSSVAARCAEAGWSVAVIEEREPGGTCALRGCNPKKVLVDAAALVDLARRSDGRLARFPDATIDWSELVEFEREFTDDVPQQTAERFEAKGIRLYRGRGRFVGPTTLQVGDERIEAGQVLIATGSRPASLDFPGAELIATSDDFLTLDELPEQVLFVGGGYISFEFAHVAARAGCQVTIVERLPRPLAGFDEDLVDRLIERTREVGIEVLLETDVTRCRSEGSGLVVELGGASGGKRGVGLVVHGGGRVPSIDGLDLHLGQVAFGDDGIEVDEHMRSTTNDRVLAAGDCVDTDAGALTPVASAHAHAIATNLLASKDGDRQRPDVRAVPRVVYNVPPLAGVGPTEAQARERGLEFEVRQGDMSGWNSVKRVSEPCAAYKLLVAPDDRLLAAHLVGPGAAETINLFVLALRAGMTASELKSAPLAFPTFGHDVRSMV
jgi:glutathione reductase (NADPH)